MCACAPVFVYVYIYIHIHTCIHTCTYLYHISCACTYTAYIYTHIHTYTHTFIHSYIHTYMKHTLFNDRYTDIYVYTHAYAQSGLSVQFPRQFQMPTCGHTAGIAALSPTSGLGWRSHLKGPKIGHLLSERGARTTERPNELRHWTGLAHATGVPFCLPASLFLSGSHLPNLMMTMSQKPDTWLLSRSTLAAQCSFG